MERIKLNDALDNILDAVVEKLNAANVFGGLLHGTECIVRGDRARPQPPAPALFVYTETARNEHTHRAMHETWTLPVILVAVVKDDEPEEGYREATSLAARARSVAIENRRLDLEYVQDVSSSRFEASAPWMREGQMFFSLAVIDVRFVVLEY